MTRRDEGDEEEDFDGPTKLEIAAVDALEATGHTRHCAARQVWGDGFCECGRRDDDPRHQAREEEP